MTETLALILLGGATIALVNLIARRSGVPAAVLLVLVGLAYAWLPGPNVQLRPTFVLDAVIPPLLYAAALNSSAIGLRRNLRPIMSLSFGLVVATALVGGAALSGAVSGLPLAAAIALGAAVAPTDPVAALAVARRSGLPPRLVTIVEGEGLLNDATALTLFQVAVASQVAGGFSFWHGAGELVLAIAGGIFAGLLTAVVLGTIRRRLIDSLADNVISLGTPFAAFLLAEVIHGSGVLAVVIAGLWFAHRGTTVQSGQSRLQSRAVWSLVEYLLEGFVFLLIGQQAKPVLHGLHDYPGSTVAAAAGITVATVLLIRPMWLALSELLPPRLHTRLGTDPDHHHRHLVRRDVIALSWAGTRGVITLAAAFAIPLTVHGGDAFPDRDLLLFCAYIVVLITLVGQGLSYGILLNRLRFPSRVIADALVRNEARVAAVNAAIARLDQLGHEEHLPAAITEPLRLAAQRRLDRYAGRIERLSAAEEGPISLDDPYFTAARVRRELIEAERDELLQWRDRGRLSDASLRALQRELDHEEGVLPDVSG